MCLLKVTSVSCAAAAAGAANRPAQMMPAAIRLALLMPYLLLDCIVGSVAPALRRTCRRRPVYPPPTVTVTSRADASPPSWA